jgi:hypothetical protein
MNKLSENLHVPYCLAAMAPARQRKRFPFRQAAKELLVVSRSIFMTFDKTVLSLLNKKNSPSSVLYLLFDNLAAGAASHRFEFQRLQALEAC